MAADSAYGLTPAPQTNPYGLTPASSAPSNYGLEPATAAPTQSASQYGLTPAQATPSLQPPPISAPSGPTSIGPARPSVWQRITNAFEAGIPALEPSGKFAAAAHTDTGTLTTGETPQMQLVTPEAAMTQSEQARHPILTGAGEAVGGMTSPSSVALIAGTGGLGELPGAAGKVVTRLMSAGFSAQAIASAYKASTQARDAFERGDTAEGERLLTQALITAGVGGLGAAHAVTGKPAITGKAKSAEAEELSPKQIIENEGMVYKGELTPNSGVYQFESPTAPGKTAALRAKDVTPENVRAKMAAKLNEFQTQPIPEDSPVASLIGNQPAPAVHLVDSEATQRTLENAQTILPAVRVFHGTSAEDVTDISKLDATYSRNGAAGKGIYVTENPEQAGQYAGPESVATGGRVVAGTLSPNANLLDGNAPLPANLLRSVQDKFKADINAKNPPTSYLDFIDQLQSGLGNVSAFQKEVAKAGFDGVRYTADYPSGPRAAIMLFGKDVSGKAAGDLLKPTIPTARVVSEDYVPAVSTDQVLAAKVQKIINTGNVFATLGLDPTKIETRADVNTMLDGAAETIKQNLDPRVGRTISLETQKQLAAETGLSIDELLSRPTGEAWNAERAIAARSLLKDSGDRVVRSARIAAQGGDQDAFVKALAQHQYVLDAVKGITSEAGRALGSFRVTEELPALKISEIMSKMPEATAAKAAQLLAKIDPNDTRRLNEFAEQIRPSSTPEKLFEIYRNTLLAGPHALLVKAPSEIAMLGLEAATRAITEGPGSAWSFSVGALQALQHTKQIISGEFQLEGAPGFEGEGPQAIKGTLGKIVRFPTTALSRETNLLYAMNYMGTINAEAAKAAASEGLAGPELYARQQWLAQNPTDAMADSAHKVALHNTFQNQLGEFGQMGQKWMQNDPTGIMRYLFPFVRTPVNLVKATGEISPYGLTKAALGGEGFLGSGEKMAAHDRASLAVRGAIGSALAAGVAYLALEGRITGGGPVDFRKNQTLQATGWQPYSLKIGDRYYSYHRFEPVGLLFGLVADAVHGIKAGDSEKATEARTENIRTHLLNNIDDLPFMNSLTNAVEALHDPSGKMVDRFIARQVASTLVPSGIANIAEATDRTVRRPDTSTLGEGVKQTIESRVPGMTNRVPAVIDVTGQPIQRPASALGGANPFPVSAATNDPATNELARLGIATPQPIRSVSAKDHAFPVTPAESQTLLQGEGRELHSVLSQFVVNPAWAGMDDKLKTQVIQKVRADIAKNRVVRLAEMRSGQQSAANQ